MRWLTEDAIPKCDHGGKVNPAVSQNFVRIESKLVLVKPDLEGRGISGCTNVNPFVGIRPCLLTLQVKEGYSQFVRIEKIPVALETVKGLTDGSPPGTVNYTILDPAQQFVAATA